MIEQSNQDKSQKPPEGGNTVSSASEPQATATAKTTPKNFTEASLAIKSKQTEYTISLIPTSTTRGDKKWVYPGLGPIIDTGEEQTVDKQYNEISSFRSEKALMLMVVEQFDRECQGIWRTSGQDVDKFSLSISDETSGRSPRKMSTYFDKQIRELTKFVKDTQAGKWTAEQTAKKTKLLLLYRDAVMTELTSQVKELEELGVG